MIAMYSLLSTVLLLGVVASLIYIWLIWNFNYWRKRDVRAPKPKPFIGCFPSFLTQQQHFADELNEFYKKYRHSEHFIGVYLIRVPQLLLLEPALIREVFVTSFRRFQDNDVSKLVDHKKDPLIACNPFIAEGQRWRDQRALVSPGLTSTRIKLAYDIMREVCAKLCAYVEQESKLAGTNGLDASELSLCFTSENVSAGVLGIDAHSFTSEKLPIAEKMKQFSQNNMVFIIYNLMVGLFPNIYKLYKPKFVPQDCEDFFLSLMKRAFDMRRKQTVERLDFLNHLLTLQEKKGITDIEMASHAWTFLLDGLDTTATAIAHCLLLLARNPTTQEKLRQEVLKHTNDAGELNFEDLNELPYLDACVHESLRIFPPALWSMKSCTEAHEFTNKNGSKLRVMPGETIIIPIYCLHMDPEYFEEPTRFMPERFLPENGGSKKYREMGVYLPFGDGPRACLGMRFALVQLKSAIVALIKHFNISVNPKTHPENQLDPKSFLAAQKGGIWLDFESRRI